MRPLSVDILHKSTSFLIGDEAYIHCQVSGSHPPPIIRWFRNGKTVKPHLPDTVSYTYNTMFITVFRFFFLGIISSKYFAKIKFFIGQGEAIDLHNFPSELDPD